MIGDGQRFNRGDRILAEPQPNPLATKDTQEHGGEQEETGLPAHSLGRAS